MKRRLAQNFLSVWKDFGSELPSCLKRYCAAAYVKKRKRSAIIPLLEVAVVTVHLVSAKAIEVDHPHYMEPIAPCCPLGEISLGQRALCTTMWRSLAERM